MHQYATLNVGLSSGLRLPVIVDPGRRDIGVAEPLLDLGDIGLMVERIRGRRRAQRVGADLEAEERGILPHQLVNAIRRDRLFRPSACGCRGGDGRGRRCRRRRARPLASIRRSVRWRRRMERHVARLFALAGDLQMRHAATFMPEVPDGELAQLLAAERVIEQGGQNGAIAHAFERFLGRRDEQLARLMVGDRRGFAFVALAPSAASRL